MYFPQMKMDEVRVTRATCRIPADGDHVVFQRVTYEDVFHRPHFSGSLHRMFIQKGMIANEPIHTKPEYWQWD